MKNLYRFIAVLALAVILSPVVASANHTVAHTIEQIQQQITALQAQIQNLRQSQQTTQASYPAVSTTVQLNSSTASNRFVINDSVVSNANVNVRTAASLSAASILIPSGTRGVVTQGPIAADGYNWWFVDWPFGADGWSAENYLSRVTPVTASQVQPTPTVSLTVTPSNVTAGQNITYTWSSANAVSWRWEMTIVNSSSGVSVASDGCGTIASSWGGPTGGNSASGTWTGATASCQAGYTYHIYYKATNTTGQTSPPAHAAVTVNAPTTSVTATTYSLTVNSSGASGAAVPITSSTGHSGSTYYSLSNITSGTNVSLTAPATVGSSAFSNWSGCDSVGGTGNRTCTLTLNYSRPATANYTPVSCSLSFSKTNITVGDNVTWTANSNPTGLSAYWYGTNNYGTYAGVTDFSQSYTYLSGDVGTHTRYLVLKDASGNQVCTTNTVNATVSAQTTTTNTTSNTTNTTNTNNTTGTTNTTTTNTNTTTTSTSAPTGSLTVTPSNVTAGQNITYTWSSANAVSWRWEMTIVNSSSGVSVASDGCGTIASSWGGPTGGNSASGTWTGATASCQAGYTYYIYYRPTNSAGTAPISPAIVKVNAATSSLNPSTTFASTLEAIRQALLEISRQVELMR